jgi:hypothetical protein
MFGALAPYAIPAGMSIAQGLLGGRQAKRDQQRMEEQAKQDKLIQSFNPQAQPSAPQQASTPGVAQQMLADPVTRRLIEQIAESKFGIKPLGSV